MSEEMTHTRESANESFERRAAEFYADTGLMAPGKDDPTGHHTYEERWAAWSAWIRGAPLPPPLPPQDPADAADRLGRRMGV